MNYEQENPLPMAEPAAPQEPVPLIPYGWLRALLFLIVYVFLSVGIASAIAIFSGGRVQLGKELDSPQEMAVQAVLLGVLLLQTWFFRRVVDRRSFMSLGFSIDKTIARHMFHGALWGIGLMTVPFLVFLTYGYLTVTDAVFHPGSLITLFFTLLFAAAIEEILCRGYLLRNLMNSMNRYVALAVVSLLFALMHGGNANLSWVGMLNIFFAGILLGIYYIHRRNLWFPISLHLFWNFFQGGIYGIPVSGTTPPGVLQSVVSGDELITGGAFGFEASLPVLIMLAAVIVVLELVYRTKTEDKQPIQPIR